jgi:hypothetical protein
MNSILAGEQSLFLGEARCLEGNRIFVDTSAHFCRIIFKSFQAPQEQFCFSIAHPGRGVDVSGAAKQPYDSQGNLSNVPNSRGGGKGFTAKNTEDAERKIA